MITMLAEYRPQRPLLSGNRLVFICVEYEIMLYVSKVRTNCEFLWISWFLVEKSLHLLGK